MKIIDGNVCSICDSKALKMVYQIPDRSPLNVSCISIGECMDCHHRFLINTPTDLLMGFYSRDENCYAFHLNNSYLRMKRVDNMLVLLLISRYLNQGQLLEIGCGTGSFLDVARMSGFSTFGVESSHWQADVVKSKNHVVFNQPFENIKIGKDKFDIVVGIELIEHILDVPIFMNRLNEITKPGSLVYFSTGSTTSFMARIKGKKWRYYEVLHTQYFCPESIQKLLEKWGWKVLEFGTGFRLSDLWRHGHKDLSYYELIKKSIARIRLGSCMKSGMHVIAKKV